MGPAPGDARILIVDDEPANVLLLERILDQAGYRNHTATTDPRQVPAIFARFDPDLVLLDLAMPHLDGLAVMTQLRQVIPEGTYLPILVLTADMSTQARAGAVGWRQRLPAQAVRPHRGAATQRQPAGDPVAAPGAAPP